MYVCMHDHNHQSATGTAVGTEVNNKSISSIDWSIEIYIYITKKKKKERTSYITYLSVLQAYLLLTSKVTKNKHNITKDGKKKKQKEFF